MVTEQAVPHEDPAIRLSVVIPCFNAARTIGEQFDAPDRQGAEHARHEAVEVARGSLLAFCDADDVVAPGWIGTVARSAFDQLDGFDEDLFLGGDIDFRWRAQLERLDLQVVPEALVRDRMRSDLRGSIRWRKLV